MKANELFPRTTKHLVQNRVVVLRYPDIFPELFNLKNSMLAYAPIERALGASPVRAAKEIMEECSRRIEERKGEEPLRRPGKSQIQRKCCGVFLHFLDMEVASTL